jgi:hypothetical protein
LPSRSAGITNASYLRGMLPWKSAILSNFTVQPPTPPKYQGDPYAADACPPWEMAPISEAVVGMLLPILGIDPCQSRISDDQEVLTIFMLCGERSIIGARDHDRSVEDHDFVVGPFMVIIKGDCDPCPHEERDRLDRGACG